MKGLILLTVHSPSRPKMAAKMKLRATKWGRGRTAVARAVVDEGGAAALLAWRANDDCHVG